MRALISRAVPPCNTKAKEMSEAEGRFPVVFPGKKKLESLHVSQNGSQFSVAEKTNLRIADVGTIPRTKLKCKYTSGSALVCGTNSIQLTNLQALSFLCV